MGLPQPSSSVDGAVLTVHWDITVKLTVCCGQRLGTSAGSCPPGSLTGRYQLSHPSPQHLLVFIHLPGIRVPVTSLLTDRQVWTPMISPGLRC